MDKLLNKIGIDITDVQPTKTPVMYLVAIIGSIYLLLMCKINGN